MGRTTLSDLPLELFQAILAECIRVRSVKRAFRLRLVNRHFATEILQVVNEFRLMDNSPIPLEDTGDFGVNYMVHRLLNPKLPVTPKWAGIRRIASRLAAEDDNDGAEYERYIEILTSRAARYSYQYSMAYVCQGHLEPNDYPDDSYSDSDEEYDLTSAAAYTNKLGLIEELTLNPVNLTIRIGTFDNPYLTAVAGGHSAALDMLLGRLRGRNITHTKEAILANASRDGSPALVEKCISEWNAKQLTFRNVQERLNAALVTPNVENFKIITRILETTPNPTLSPERLANCLDFACWHGWEDMVRHLISLGAPVQGDYSWSSRDYWPLKSASRHDSPAMVQLLLEHGVRVQGGEIEEAAEKGRWDVMRILAAQGADVNQAVCGAVKRERGDIVRQLVERGASLEGDVEAQALEIAKKDGLESMVALLEQLMTS